MNRIVHVTERLIEDLRGCLIAERSPQFTVNCLIVEDDPLQTAIASRAIDSIEGSEAVFATSADEAITLLRQSASGFRPTIHILFLDLNLNGSFKNGYEVLKHVRTEFPDTHVILTGGNIDNGIFNFICDDRQSGGYIGMMTKPLTGQNLRAIFAKHCIERPDLFLAEAV